MKSRVLIIDDAPSDLKVLATVLGDAYRVSVATSGPQGLELARRQPPDIILLDIIMPEMDGFAVIKELKQDPELRDIPVIFLTVVDAVEEKVRGFSCGAVDYVTKPFEPLEVRARVRTHLRLERALAQLEAQNEELQAAARLREEVEQVYRHDLKNPLNAVLGASDLLLLQGGLSENQRAKVECIRQGAFTMLDMINRYFDLFKIEQGMYALQPVAVDIVKVVRRVLQDLANVLQNKALTVDFQVAGDAQAILISGEEMLCYSMVANLVRNAAEAVPRGGEVAIRIEEGPRVAIRIANNGEVPAEIRPCFFDKYVTCGKKRGLGLGTYSARMLAELQGGGISLDASRPGRTEIKVVLPRFAGTHSPGEATRSMA